MITDQSVQMILDKLSLLAQKLGSGIENLFPYFLKQQYIISVLGIVEVILTTGYFISMFTWIPKLVKISKDRDWCEMNFTVGIIVFVLSIGAFIFFTDGILNILHFLNPQYYAIKSILEMLTPSSYGK